MPERRRWLTWGVLVLLAILWLADFHLDVRGQDAQTWMDPYQYLGSAEALAAGEMALGDLTLPSVFPFFIAPALALSPTIPAALWVNAAFMALLLFAIHLLCREIGIATPSAAPALLVLSSPVLIGLSRSLYVEWALTALGALACWSWLRLLRSTDARRAALFATIFAAGFLMKMTFPLFVALPLLCGALGLALAGRPARAIVLAAAVVIPALVVLGVQALFFPGTLAYYETLGNTTMPIMYLIGPEERLSPASLAYYPAELWKSLVGLPALFLLLPLLPLRGAAGRLRPAVLAGEKAALWAWLAGPLILLTLQTVKEPRHVAPCAVPAALLVVASIESLRGRAARAGLLAAALAAGAGPYGAVTSKVWEAPYFLDGPLRLDRIVSAMERARGGDPADPGEPPALRDLSWRFNRNVVLDGFEPNAALALTWRLFPAVTYDLATLPAAGAPPRAARHRSFEDLFILAAFDTYNRRCGWEVYDATLPREEILRHAEIVVVKGGDPAEASARHPAHRLAESLDLDDGPVHVLVLASGVATPYRALFAERYLAGHPDLDEAEREVIARELLYVRVLGGRMREAEALLGRFPRLREGSGGRRNIYWIGAYNQLHELARRRYLRFAGAGGA